MNSIYATTRGMLLLATPPLDDPNFDRTVIYMMEHNADGAVGLVLNRPTEETSVDGLDLWMDLAVSPAVVFDGGPVQFDALIALAELHGPHEGAWSPILPDLGSVDLALDPIEVADSITRVRVFRGYAGWSSGQLDGELVAGAWMVFGAQRNDVFSESPEELWRDVLRRQPGRVAWVANAPDDLSMN
ncbi:MAG: YqgE/AlgH family protein [Ilumatobacteraceae bacterium]